MKAYYDLVLILGPDSDFSRFKTAYEQTGLKYIIIGDGKQPVTEAQLSALDGKIARRTRIDIFAHGNVDQGKHFMGLMENEQDSRTSDLFRRLRTSYRHEAFGRQLQVHLWSCYAGAAKSDLAELPKKTLLITHASSQRSSYMSMNEEGLISGIMRHKDGINPYVDFAHAITSSPETATLSTHYASAPIHYTARCPNQPLPSNQLKTYLRDYILANYITALKPLAVLAGHHQSTKDIAALPITAETLESYTHNACLLEPNLNDLSYIARYLKQTAPTIHLLHFAAAHTEVSTVSMLLIDGRSDPNQTNSSGNTPLHISARDKQLGNLVILLADDRTDPDRQNQNGDTALHLAASTPNQSGTVRLLSLHGRASSNIPNHLGQTPLHLAARHADGGNVRALLADKLLDPNCPDADQRTALHYAAMHGDAMTILALLADGRAHPNAQDKYGKTALHYAADHQNPAALRALLVDHRVHRNAQDEDGTTALHDAISSGRLENMKLLLADPHANPDTADMFGRTALYQAVLTQNPDFIWPVVKKGASASIPDFNNETPLQLAEAQAASLRPDAPLSAHRNAALITALLSPFILDTRGPTVQNMEVSETALSTQLTIKFSTRAARDEALRANQSFINAINRAAPEKPVIRIGTDENFGYRLGLGWDLKNPFHLTDKLNHLTETLTAQMMPAPCLTDEKATRTLYINHYALKIATRATQTRRPDTPYSSFQSRIQTSNGAQTNHQQR